MIDPFTRLLRHSAANNGPVVLMYHAIEQVQRTPSWTWSVSVRRFTEHLDLLRDDGWSTCTVRELQAAGSVAINSKTAVITFDDGFANNIDAAAALSDHGMRATWFIVGGAIGREPFWPDTGRPTGRMMTIEELRRLDAAGMEIGAHGVNHLRLTELVDGDLAHEVRDSKAILEDILGKPVTSFAYPYGAWDERCETAVRVAGYLAACTTRSGTALKDNNPYRLRRIEIVNRDSAARFTRKLALLTNDGSLTNLLGYLAGRAYRRIRGAHR